MSQLRASDFIRVKLDHPRGEVCGECGFPFDTDAAIAYVNQHEQMVYCSKECLNKNL